MTSQLSEKGSTRQQHWQSRAAKEPVRAREEAEIDAIRRDALLGRLSAASLQRLLSSLARPVEDCGGRDAEARRWHDVLNLLKQVAQLEAPRVAAPLSYTRLRGGQLRCQGGAVNLFRSTMPGVARDGGKPPDAQAITLCAWVAVQPEGALALAPAAVGVLWRYVDPSRGGWEVRLRHRPHQDGSLEAVYAQLAQADGIGAGRASATPGSEAESLETPLSETILGTVLTQQWHALTLEIQMPSSGRASMRLGGKGKWVPIDLNMSCCALFPPPGREAPLVSCSFFDGLPVDVGAVWLLSSACGMEAAAWLRRLYLATGTETGRTRVSRAVPSLEESSAEGPWRTAGGLGILLVGEEEETDWITCRKPVDGEAEVLAGAVLGYVPGPEHDLVNFHSPLEGGGDASRRMWGSIEIVDAVHAEETSVVGPCLRQLQSPGFAVGMLWAMARSLLRLQDANPGASNAESATACTQVVNCVFDFLVQLLLCKRRYAAAGDHYFVRDGGFAVWSYVLRRFVQPVWLNSKSAEVLIQLFSEAAEGGTWVRECRAHLVGAHMTSYWRRCRLEVQEAIWSAICSPRGVGDVSEGLVALGGLEWILLDATSCKDDLSIFTMKLLLALDAPQFRESTEHWMLLTRFKASPARYALVALSALRGKQLLRSLGSIEQDAVLAKVMASFCEHPEEAVWTEALLCLWQLEANHVKVPETVFATVRTRILAPIDEAARRWLLACKDVLWAWLSQAAPPLLEWDETLPLQVKVRQLTGRASDIAELIYFSTSKTFQTRVPPHAGHLLCAVLNVLELLDEDGATLDFLQEFTLWLGNLAKEAGHWWQALLPFCSEWHQWLLRLMVQKVADDDLFAAAAKLHTNICTSAISTDNNMWHLVQELVWWANRPDAEDYSEMVCRTLLVHLFEAVAARFEVKLQNSLDRWEPLAHNIAQLVPVLDGFLLPHEKPPPEPAPKHGVRRVLRSARSTSSGSTAGTHAARPTSGEGRAHPQVWMDYQIAFHLIRLWGRLLRDPLAGHPVLGFDLSAWLPQRWTARPYPLDGTLEGLLLTKGEGAVAVPRFVFTRLMHWGTRCLFFDPPTERELRYLLGKSAQPGNSASGSRPEICRTAVAASAVAIECSAASLKREVLTVLRQLALCSLVIGAHGERLAQPAILAAEEELARTVVCFCAHSCMVAGATGTSVTRDGQLHKSLTLAASQEEALASCARDSCAETLLLMLLICCQKWGRPAAGFSETNLRDFSQASQFPGTILQMLPMLNWRNMAQDTREVLAKQPGPKAWFGSTTQWTDPATLIERFGFVGRQNPSKSSGRSGAAAWPWQQVPLRWNIHKAISESDAARTAVTLLVAAREDRPRMIPIPDVIVEAIAADNASTALANPQEDGASPSGRSSPERVEHAVDQPASHVPIQSAQAASRRQHAPAAGFVCGSPDIQRQDEVLATAMQRGRALRHCRRAWSSRAWRMLCRTVAVPGSVWHSPTTWVHPEPPLQPLHKSQGESRVDTSGLPQADGSVQEEAHSSSKPLSRRDMWLQSSFECTTAGTVAQRARHKWCVSRLEDSSGRRPFLTLAHEDWDGGSSSCRSSSSSSSSSRGQVGSGSGSDTEDASDGPCLLQVPCTWIRRETSKSCVLRLYPAVVVLELDRSALGPGRQRRVWSFPVSALKEGGVRPRRFLHRHTALELHFTAAHASGPICLHFDQVSRFGDGADDASVGQAQVRPGHLAAAPRSSSQGLSDAASALLGRLGLGSPSTGGRWGRSAQGAHRGLLHDHALPGVSVRDEVWFRVLALQRRGEATKQVTRSSADVHYEPPSCWGRATQCRRLPKALRTRRAASHGMLGSPQRQQSLLAELGEVAQVLRPSDIQKMQKQQLESMESKREVLTTTWRRGDMSNFAYLMAINRLSGRSLEDLSQYPVMPWVLMHLWFPDPPSTILARGDAAEVARCFRDISRTLGDVGYEERRQNLQEKFKQLREQDCTPYHYGTHYSTPAFAMHFLIRVQPFNLLARTLQGGKYDVADRIFWSLKESWRSCSTEMSDVRELMPEIYSLPECLINISGCDFGTRQDGLKVGHVVLPDWARDAYHFIHEHRIALESAPVSKKLAGWIDLIWGVKQRGLAAHAALNVFYPLTYEEGVEWEKTDPKFRHCKEQQVLHFGQTPPQVFKEPHLERERGAYAPSLLQEEVFGSERTEHDICRWHSSAISSLYDGARSSEIPVVAMVQSTMPGEPARLHVLKADGTLNIFRVFHPVLFPGPSMARALGMPALQDAKEDLSVAAEASFIIPRTEDASYERLLQAEELCEQPNCWALLADPLFFVHAGYRDGTIVYGSPKKDAHALAVVQAHACMVTAVGASQVFARWVDGSSGLVVMAGSADGVVSLWVASDPQLQQLFCLTRSRPHLGAVRCIDFNASMGLAATGAEDGLAHIYTTRPLLSVLRTFATPDRTPVSQVRFGSRAPATLVAATSGEPVRLCVWSLQGYILANLAMPEGLNIKSLQLIDDSDTQEALLCACSFGTWQLLALPYLNKLWQFPCQRGAKPSVFSTSRSRRLAWLGLADGTFEAAYIRST